MLQSKTYDLVKALVTASLGFTTPAFADLANDMQRCSDPTITHARFIRSLPTQGWKETGSPETREETAFAAIFLHNVDAQNPETWADKMVWAEDLAKVFYDQEIFRVFEREGTNLLVGISPLNKRACMVSSSIETMASALNTFDLSTMEISGPYRHIELKTQEFELSASEFSEADRPEQLLPDHHSFAATLAVLRPE